MDIIIVAALVNFSVGLSVGICGIAGFLLPLFYIEVMHTSTILALALSFISFVIAGILGSYSFYKNGYLNIKITIWLSIGSVIGAIIGVAVNHSIPENIVKIILYFVVLVSGISIIRGQLRERKTGRIIQEGVTKCEQATEEKRLQKIELLIMGVVTSTLCALSGAGGPVLVMPLLVALGIPVHVAIGIALLNSVFIGGPAVIGYMSLLKEESVLPWLWMVIGVHGSGVLLGSKLATKIDATVLKWGVAVFSVLLGGAKLIWG